jgi:hypothetical protein
MAKSPKDGVQHKQGEGAADKPYVKDTRPLSSWFTRSKRPSKVEENMPLTANPQHELDPPAVPKGKLNTIDYRWCANIRCSLIVYRSDQTWRLLRCETCGTETCWLCGRRVEEHGDKGIPTMRLLDDGTVHNLANGVCGARKRHFQRERMERGLG